MAGYTRVDTINNIADGNVINAADLDGEFDGIQSAFNASTGHNHDGTAGEGAPILALGPTQNVTISASVLGVATTNTVDLGTSSLKFKDFYLAGAASIGGTLGVTGATTLSAALTYGGVTLSNAVTGTGNMVLSASPTLTGTITAAAANFSGAVALNGNTTIGDADTDTITQAASYVTGTQLKSAKTATNTLNLAAYDTDGAAYTNLITLTASTTPTLALTSTGVGTINNMSIGATTASTGAFTSLTASTTLSVTGVATFSAGAAGTPSITTTGDTNTGMWFPAADTIAFTEGGVESVRIDSSGNMGIGTASPTGKLHVSGFVLSGGQNYSARFSDAVNSTYSITHQSGLTNLITDTAMAFYTSNAEKMRIDTSGNVGIGTSSPSYKLQVSSTQGTQAITSTTAGQASYLILTNSADSSNSYVYVPNKQIGIVQADTSASSVVYFSTQNTERMRIDSSGNVGIGTSSPSANSLTIASKNVVMTSGFGMSWNSGATQLAGYDTNVLQFITASAERMRIDSSGNVGIGTSSPASRLNIATGASASCTFTLTSNNTGTGAGDRGRLDFNSATNSGTAYQLGYMDYDRSDGTGTASYIAWANRVSGTVAERMRIDSSGNVGIGTTSPSTQLQMNSSAATYSDQLRIRNTNFGNADIGVGSGIMAVATDMSNIAFYTSSNLGTTGSALPNNERMRIDSSGNLLVGTTAQIRSGLLSVSGVISTNNNINWGPAGNGRIFSDVNWGCIFQADRASPASAEFLWQNAGSTERMRIDTSGNLLVGTSTNNGVITSFTTSASGRAGFFMVNAASSLAADAVGISKADNNTTTSQVFVKFFINSNATASGLITAGGANQATFTSSSDSRLKENIVDLPSQLANIMALRPVEFDYIESEGGGHQIGFIAQEVKEIYPDVVGIREDGMFLVSDLNKNDARLIKAIQEQQALITALTARITALESI